MTGTARVVDGAVADSSVDGARGPDNGDDEHAHRGADPGADRSVRRGEGADGRWRGGDR
jgi:hypothetical protein